MHPMRVPPLVLRDGSLLQLAGDGGQDFTGIVGKVQVSHFRRGHGDDGERLFVLFECRGADLELRNVTKATT